MVISDNNTDNEFNCTSRPIYFPDVRDALARVSRRERATTQILNVQSLLQFWLWGSDANEVCNQAKCDFHAMHLTGMVCTRVFTEAYQEVSDPVDFIPSVIDDEDVRILTDSCTIFLPHFYGVNSHKPQKYESEKSDPMQTDPMQPDPVQSDPMQSDPMQLDPTVPSESDPRDPNEPETKHCVDVLIEVPGLISLQQLRDLVHALQTQWPLIQNALEKCDSPTQKLELLQIVDRLVTQLFVWFGYYLFEGNIQGWQADDTEFIDSIPPTHALAMTEMGIKFYINIFFVLFRLLFLQRHTIAVPKLVNDATGCYPFAIEGFHLEAGVDDFHLLGMYFDIPAGCLLEYKHSYSGYYNNVSQCVYRHFPSYQRRRPVSLSDILSEDAADLSVIPALKQIYPEIEFAFEDHHFYREIAGVRVPVLLAHSHSNISIPLSFNERNSTCTDLYATNTTGPALPQKKISEKLQARLAVCKEGANVSGDSKGGGVEAGRSANVSEWFWFVIGANIYLICSRDGRAYSGSCRDLLGFYLSRINGK